MIVQRSLLGTIAFLVIVSLVRPTAASSPSRAPDVAKIDAFVRRQVQIHAIPGLALALVEGDQVIHLGGYGKADLRGRAVTPQTPFVLASASKPITALAIMQLVESGKVTLDAPVQRYLPSFQLANPVASQQITVRHLLNHTSGIPEQGCQNSRLGAKTLEQFVAALQTIKPDAPAGTRHFYCSGNYNVLGRLIEVVSGQSYAGYIKQHVFAPLQMHHSFTSEQAARQDGLAQGYGWLFGVRVPMDYPSEMPQLPSGFLIASAEDMAHFLVAQLNGGRFGSASVLQPQGIAAMQAPGVVIGSGKETYGLGWRTGSFAGVPVIHHPGAHPNARTFLFMQPDTRRGAVLLMNSSGLLADLTAFTAIKEGVARLLAGQELPPVSPLTLPALYRIVDAVLAGLLALALWPILRLRSWELRQQAARLRRRWVSMRLVWEFGVPFALLLGVRLLLNGLLGTQSWAEDLLVLPDFVLWLWAISLLMLFTGVIRLVLLLRVLRGARGGRRLVAPASQGLTEAGQEY